MTGERCPNYGLYRVRGKAADRLQISSGRLDDRSWARLVKGGIPVCSVHTPLAIKHDFRSQTGPLPAGEVEAADRETQNRRMEPPPPRRPLPRAPPSVSPPPPEVLEHLAAALADAWPRYAAKKAAEPRAKYLPTRPSCSARPEGIAPTGRSPAAERVSFSSRAAQEIVFYSAWLGDQWYLQRFQTQQAKPAPKAVAGEMDTNSGTLFACPGVSFVCSTTIFVART